MISNIHETYQDITAYLDSPEKQSLEIAMLALPDKTEQVRHVLQNADLSAPLFGDDCFPLYALRALKEEKIDSLAFTTSQLFFNAMYHNRGNTALIQVPLFTQNTINPEAWNMVQLSSRESRPLKRFPHRLTVTDQQISHYFELCQNLPALERQYLVLLADITPCKTITDRLCDLNFTPLICYTDANNRRYRVIASKGMMQAYMQARVGPLAPRMITRFKLSPLNSLRDLIPQNARDFCLNFLPLTLVREADSFRCDPRFNECEAHDFYHANVVANIPLMHRVRFFVLAVLFQNFRTGASIAAKLIDMEHTGYAPTQSPFTLELVFWKSVAQHIPASSVDIVHLIAQIIFKNKESYRYIGIDPVSHITSNPESFTRFCSIESIDANSLSYAELMFHLSVEIAYQNRLETV